MNNISFIDFVDASTPSIFASETAIIKLIIQQFELTARIEGWLRELQL